MYRVSHQVEIKEEEQGDKNGSSKSTNEPAGSGEQEKIEKDDGFDQVDAASYQPVSIAQQQDNYGFRPVEQESQSAVEQHKGTNTEVPKIEVITTTTQSNLSSEEDSGASEERKKKKKKKRKKQTGSTDQDEVDNGELKDEVDKLTSENEKMKQTIQDLSKEKSSLEENLAEEKSKIEVREWMYIVETLPG